MTASIIIDDKAIKTESLPININLLSSTVGDVILIRSFERTYKVIMTNEGRLIMVKV